MIGRQRAVVGILTLCFGENHILTYRRLNYVALVWPFLQIFSSIASVFLSCIFVLLLLRLHLLPIRPSHSFGILIGSVLCSCIITWGVNMTLFYSGQQERFLSCRHLQNPKPQGSKNLYKEGIFEDTQACSLSSWEVYLASVNY